MSALLSDMTDRVWASDASNEDKRYLTTNLVRLVSLTANATLYPDGRMCPTCTVVDGHNQNCHERNGS